MTELKTKMAQSFAAQIKMRPQSSNKKKKKPANGPSGRFEIDEKLTTLKEIASANKARRRGSGSPLKAQRPTFQDDSATARREDIDQAGTTLASLAANFDFSLFSKVSEIQESQTKEEYDA